jgi:hypothetical protein
MSYVVNCIIYEVAKRYLANKCYKKNTYKNNFLYLYLDYYSIHIFLFSFDYIMKLSALATFINRAFQFVIINSEKYHIDESHALRHSMDVYHFASQIYNSEVETHPYLEKQQSVIYGSAILHDMCDKKYMDEKYGLLDIREYMKDYMTKDDLHTMSNIISTMSYSKVKQVGFPNMGDHQLAYHIVREADLLAGYDVSRSIIYQMMHEKYKFVDSIGVANALFNSRIFTYIPDKLFVTDFSKQLSAKLHEQARADVNRMVEINKRLLRERRTDERG